MDLLRWTADATFVRLLDVVMRATLVALAGHAVLLMLRPAAAATRHAIALLALAAMLLMPAATMLLPAWRLPILPTSTPRAVAPVAHTARMAVEGLDRSLTARDAARPNHDWSPSVAEVPPTSALHAVAAAHSPRRPLPWTALPFAIALGVAAVLIARVGLALARARRLERRARPVDDPRMIGALAHAKAQLAVRRDVTLAISSDTSVPIVAGCVHAAVVLPDDALAWSQDRLDVVLLHEMAHVRRHDVLSVVLVRLGTAMMWFHPLAWTLARVAERECERASDDLVLGLDVRPSDYARHLLEIAHSATGRGTYGMLPAFARHSTLEWRMHAILRAGARRGRNSPRTLALGTLVALLFVVPLATVRVVAAPARHTTRMESDATAFAWRSSEVSKQDITEPLPEPDGAMTQDEPASPEAWSERARTAYEEQRFGDAGVAYTHAAEGGYRAAMSWYNAACCFAREGKRARALDALVHAIEGGFDGHDLFRSDDDLATLRDDARFQMLIENVPGDETPNALEDNAEAKSDAWKAKADADEQRMKDEQHAREMQDEARAGDEQSMKDAEKAKDEKKDAEKWKDEEKQKEEMSAKDRARHDADVWANATPDDPQVWKAAGMTRLRSGDPEGAVEAFQRQIALEPTASATYNLACALAQAGHRTQALDALERSVLAGYGDGDKLREDSDLDPLRGEPRFAPIVHLADDLTLDLSEKGDDDRRAWRASLSRYERAATEHSTLGRAWFNLGYASLRAGNAAASVEAWQKALDLGYRTPTTLYNLACASAQRGDRDAAMGYLARAESSGAEFDGLATDSDLDPLRDDPRFQAMVARHEAVRAAKNDGEKHKAKRSK